MVEEEQVSQGYALTDPAGGSPVSVGEMLAQYLPPHLHREYLLHKSRTTPLGKVP